MSADLEQQLAQLQEENTTLKSQLGQPDLKAFEQIKELRSSNKRLTDEVKRLTSEGVQLAFKNRQLDQQFKKLQQELLDTQEQATATQVRLEQELAQARELGAKQDHSIEDLQGELTQSRERIHSHEVELELQKEALSQRQQDLSHLQAELVTREDRISKLEQLVHDFKEQFLSGDDFSAVDSQVSQPTNTYGILMTHLDLALGIPGRTLVDQVYQLLELPQDCSDTPLLEELFDTLQDTGCQLFSEEREQASLKAALAEAWQQVFKTELPTIDNVSVIPDATPEPLAAAITSTIGIQEAEPSTTITQPPVSLELPDLTTTDDAHTGLESSLSQLGLNLELEPDETTVDVATTAEPEITSEIEIPDLNLEELMSQVSDTTPSAEISPPVTTVLASEDTPAQQSTADTTEPAWAPAAALAKFEQIANGLTLASSNPKAAAELLEQALEVEIWVENEAKAYLTLARIHAGQENIISYLNEALNGIEMTCLFQLLASAESTANDEQAEKLALLYQFATSPPAEVQTQELSAGMGKHSLNRDFVASLGNEEEENIIVFLRDNLLPKANLILPLPSAQFEQRLEDSGPAAYSGTLRQALKAVDYALLDIPELQIKTYHGDDQFLVDAATQPELTVIFHRSIEDMPPEELRFLFFRHLLRLVRGHSQLSDQSKALTNAQRLQLAHATVELYLEEGSVPNPVLMDQLQALESESSEFEHSYRNLLLHWYQATDWIGFLYTREFAFQDEIFLKRLNPVVDYAAARLVGITTATCACLREELLAWPELLEEAHDGLGDLFEHGTDMTAARLRLQRMWNQFLLEKE